MDTFVEDIILKQGTAAALSAYILRLGEPGFATDTLAFRIGDGITPGGVNPFTSATLASLGAIFNTRSAKTGAYTALLADKGKLIEATSGTWTLALTAAATLGDGWTLAVFNVGSGVVTLDPNSAETIQDINGTATTKDLAQGEGGILFCNGTNFYFLRIGYTGTTQSAGDNSAKYASTAYADRAASVADVNLQTGTSYTLVLADRFKTIHMSNGSANVVTIPPNSSVAFPVGTRIPGWTIGGGQTTLTPGAGVTLNSRGGALKSAGQYAAWFLEKQATDVWLVSGDLTT